MTSDRESSPVDPASAGDPAEGYDAGGDMPPSLLRVPVIMERMEDGRIRMTSPDLPGWAAIGRGPYEIARMVDSAIGNRMRDLQIAAYSERRRARRVARPTDTVRNPRTGSRVWRVSHDPAAWEQLDDGRWRSPGGLTYGPETAVVRRVRARLQQQHQDEQQQGEQRDG